MTSATSKPANLTKGHLEVLSSSLRPGAYEVTVKETSEGLWTIRLLFEGELEDRPVTRARGGMKVWRDVIGAITFVQQNCDLAKSVCVEVGGWKLSLLEKASQGVKHG